MPKEAVMEVGGLVVAKKGFDVAIVLLFRHHCFLRTGEMMALCFGDLALDTSLAVYLTYPKAKAASVRM